VVAEIAAAIESVDGARVLHTTLDADHHRSVITFAGAPESVVEGAVRAVTAATVRIDLTQHSGVHPRLGAADVVPLVPVEGVTLDECRTMALELGRQIWQRCRVPVYFYEAAATNPERMRLENVRRGGFEVIRDVVIHDPSRRPDVGGPELHPTAGAVIVGARKFLIAWNVNLATSDLSVAKSIAREIRASSGGFPHLKALGLPLQTRGQVQVSMNLTDFEVTPMHVVFDAIRKRAREMGVEIAGTEIIGLIPRAAIERAAEAWFRFENFSSEKVLEQRVQMALER
jgi:glutamate formiminotransferase